MASSLGRVVSEPLKQPHFHGVSSGITLARLVMAALHLEDAPPSSPSTLSNHNASLKMNPEDNLTTPQALASLPPRNVGEHLLRVYFEYRTPHLPIISRTQAAEALKGAYLVGKEMQPANWKESRDLFTTFMLFAIALCDVYHPSGTRPPESEECFHSALREVNKIFNFIKSTETLQMMLLVCQYVALCPSKGSLWLLTGTSMRLAVDIGLHWESQDSENLMQLSSLTEQRRLWWSSYLFDRSLCITLGRPFAMADQGINVELPTLEYDERFQEYYDQDKLISESHNCIIQLARLESEIKHVLYSQFKGSSLAYPKANHALWLNDIQSRLHEWYGTIPQFGKITTSSIFANHAYWDAIHSNALLLLYRPNPVIPQPPLTAIRASCEAARKLVACVRTLNRERKIDITWKWTHHLFIAGLTVLYCLWHSCELRGVSEVKHSISTLQICNSELSALSEQWDGASGCRDAFEALSSTTVDWLITSSTEEMQNSRREFERQLRDLRHQTPSNVIDPSLTDEPSSMFSPGNFAFPFGETLSSVADWTWPALQDAGLEPWSHEVSVDGPDDTGLLDE